MNYLDFIAQLHEAVQPRSYLEIGVRGGDSLSLSRCESIGIDPDFAVNRELRAPTSLMRAKSDDYFEALGGRSPFEGRPIDLAFIDGMHLIEFVVKDFANVEMRSEWSTVVVLDDVLPRNVDEAARDRHTQEWTGDVFKIRNVLASIRPDLSLVVVDTQPTGLMIVLGLDPHNRQLFDEYDEIVRIQIAPDPQVIPSEVLERSGSLAPETALALPVWNEIRSGRDRYGAAAGRDAIAGSLKALT